MYTIIPKPRIRLHRGYGQQWICMASLFDMIGWGETPSEAYTKWKELNGYAS